MILPGRGKNGLERIHQGKTTRFYMGLAGMGEEKIFRLLDQALGEYCCHLIICRRHGRIRLWGSF